MFEAWFTVLGRALFPSILTFKSIINLELATFPDKTLASSGLFWMLDTLWTWKKKVFHNAIIFRFI